MHTKRLAEITLSEIVPNRFQPRIHFDDLKIESLAKSIMTYGVLEPIIVRPLGEKYEIIAGERRFKASKIAGKSTIPAIIVDFNDKESIELALLENIQRQELTAIEEAIAYRRILDMGQITQEELARKTGKSQPTIANKMRLLALDDETQEALIKHKISERHARSLLKLAGTPNELKMLNFIIEKRLTVRDTDLEIAKLLEEKELNKKEKKGEKKFMDIEKIMKEAQDINVSEEPKKLNDFVTTPSPYETILGSNEETSVSQIDDIAGIMGANQPEEHNKFINIIPQEEKIENVRESKEQAEHPTVTFGNVFNSVFDVPTPNNVSNEEVSLENRFNQAPLSQVDEKPNLISGGVSDSSVLSTTPEFTSPITQITSVNKDVTPIISDVAQNMEIPASSEITEIPEFTSPIVESIPTQETVTPVILETPIVEGPITPEIEMPISTDIEVPTNPEISDIPEFTSTIAESISSPTLSQTYDSIESLDFPENDVETVVSPMNNQSLSEKSFTEVLDVLKECSDKIKALGYDVSTNEFDLENLYQMTFLIKKELR